MSVDFRLAWIFCAILRKLRESGSVTYVNMRPHPPLVSCVLHQNLLREEPRLDLLRISEQRERCLPRRGKVPAEQGDEVAPYVSSVDTSPARRSKT